MNWNQPYGTHIILCTAILIIQCLHLSLGQFQPTQIVRPTSTHSGLEIIEENLQWLVNLREPISIISAVGPYHSGKSFLLNALMDFPSNGFQIGPSTEPQTMGIWIMKSNLRSPVDNSTILLIDTEGFYGSNISEAYDAKIFTVATLISSHLLYNSVKLIDQQAVDYVELLTRRTQLLQLKNTLAQSSTRSKNISLPMVLKGDEFPKLTWVVKDFVQRLEGKTPTEWLFEFIEAHQRDSVEVNSPGDARHSAFVEIFQNVDCQTLFLPATQLSHLQDLSTLKPSEFTTEFRSNLQKLKKDILGGVKSKRTQQGPLNGASFLSLLRFIIKSVNDEQFPQLPSLWNTWLSQLTGTATSDSVTLYKTQIEAKLSTTEPPSQEELSEEYHPSAKQNATIFFKDLLFNFQNLWSPNVPKLEQLIEEKFEVFKVANNEAIRSVVAALKDDECNRITSEYQHIPLPAQTKALEATFQQLEKKYIGEFDKKLSKYAKSSIFAEYKAGLQSKLNEKKNEVSLNNKNFIEEILRQASASYEEVYQSNMITFEPISPAELQQKSSEANAKAKESFISKLKVDWLQEETVTQGSLALVEQKCLQKFLEYNKENEAKIAERCSRVSIELVTKFKAKTRDIRPFPDEEEIIQPKLAHIHEEISEEWKSLLHHFGSSSSLSKGTLAFQERIAECIRDFMDQNIKMMKSACYDAFKCADRKLGASICTFCFSNLVPWGHRWKAVSAAQECFKSDPIASQISPQLQEKVILDWYHDERGSQAKHVWANFLVLVMIPVTIGLMWLCMGRKAQAAPVNFVNMKKKQ